MKSSYLQTELGRKAKDILNDLGCNYVSIAMAGIESHGDNCTCPHCDIEGNAYTLELKPLDDLFEFCDTAEDLIERLARDVKPAITVSHGGYMRTRDAAEALCDYLNISILGTLEIARLIKLRKESAVGQ